MTTEERSNLLRKLEHIRNLAMNAGTPEEAAAAAMKMQELLDKYHVDESELDKNVLREFERANAMIKETIWINQGSGTGWRRNLVYSLARNNWCRAIDDTHGRKGNAKMHVVGKTTDVEVVVFLNNFLSTNLLQQANERIAKGEHRAAFVHALTWKDSFLYGAVAAIDLRLKQQRQKFTAVSESNANLVETSYRLVDTAYKEFFPNVGTIDNSQIGYSSHGASAGIEYGRSVNLDPQRLPGHKRVELLDQ